MSIDQEWFTRQVEAYVQVRSRYVELADVLQQRLQSAAQRFAPAALIQTRAKSVASFADKALRNREAYPDPVQQLIDLCGARVVCHTRQEAADFSRFIREHFEVDELQSQDTAVRLASSEFGYRSVHFVVELKPGAEAGVPGAAAPEELFGLKAEIQVRTTAQHAWADIGHDRLYKSEFDIPHAWRREAARIAALLESADDSFGRLVELIDSYRCHYDAYLDREQMADKRERLAAVLVYDPENEVLVREIARLSAAMEEWQGVVHSIERFAGPRTAALETILGFALCRLYEDQRHGADYAAARRCFERAIELEPGRLDAHLHLADSWEGIDDERALESSERAFTLAPDDPRTLATFLVHKIARDRSLSAIPLLRPSIEEAVSRCAEQARLRVNLPWAWYWRAMFQTLLGRPYEALEDLCRAVALSTAEFMFDRALDATALLSEAEAAPPTIEWNRRLLLVAKAARFPQADADESPSRLASRPAPPLEKPVIVVTGGCHAAFEELTARYRDLLGRALEDFHGTVISGGTTAGVSGLVGELASQAGNRMQAIGYLPGSVPADATVDRRYHHLVTTSGVDFSALEPLQMWIDLMAAGISPTEVKVLGIGGGTIARFEYQLALTLGASLGVLRNSGRAAGQIAQEFSGDRPGRLAALPDDAMTVRTFVEQGAPSLLSDAEREATAKAIHDEYRRTQSGRLLRVDSAMVDWDRLSASLRQSNLQQADHIQQKLAAIRMRAVPVADRQIKLVEFTPKQVERMAEMEHARWNVERLLDGWSLGPRDPDKKQSPYLVGWSVLADDVREWDRQAVRAIPAFLARIGLEVQAAEP